MFIYRRGVACCSRRKVTAIQYGEGVRFGARTQACPYSRK